MDAASLVRLLALAALWGASFLFMRVAVPVVGPLWLAEARVGLAALFLAGVALALRKPLQWRAHARHYLVLGLFNSALPFLLYAFAARTLPASLLAIVNASAPLWGALLVALRTRQRLAAPTLAGLLLGMAGVALIVGFDTALLRPGAPLALLAALAAPLSYGFASTCAKTAPQIEPHANAHGSMWAATLLLAPALPFVPAPGAPGPAVLGAVLALGVACSGLAYLLYFRLIADLGPGPALSVTFLIPAFGVLWGHLFLGEPVGWHTGLGMAVVLAGTALVTGFRPAALRRGARSCP